MIKEAGELNLQLFAKLSKILAETFEDIHKICLRQSEGEEKVSDCKRSDKKQQWLDKIEESKLREEPNQYAENRMDVEQDESRPPKFKKTKTRPFDNQNENRQKKQEKKKKVAKWQQEGKPRPPLNAFMLFLRDSKFQIMEAKPELTPSQVSAYASALWNELTEDQKQKYRGEYRQNRVRYDEELKQYHEKQKISGRLPLLKSKKGIEKNDRAEKDILNRDLNNDSDISDSLSGI